jgi:TPR repeat protein
MILLVAMLFAAPKTPPRAAEPPLVSAAQLKKSCKQGKGAACDELGNRARFGVDMAISDAQAADYFQKACAAKDPDGCADDAFASGMGISQKADRAKAIDRLDRQCKTGVARACGHLATLYDNRFAGADEAARAGGMWVDACKKGHLESCTHVSAAAFTNGDFARFRQYGRAACDNGDADGCASFAELLLEMKEVLNATTDFAHACELGSTRGCTGQGMLMIEAGADQKKTLSLLDRSCQREDPRACAAARVARDRK